MSANTHNSKKTSPTPAVELTPVLGAESEQQAERGQYAPCTGSVAIELVQAGDSKFMQDDVDPDITAHPTGPTDINRGYNNRNRKNQFTKKEQKKIIYLRHFMGRSEDNNTDKPLPGAISPRDEFTEEIIKMQNSMQVAQTELRQLGKDDSPRKHVVQLKLESLNRVYNEVIFGDIQQMPSLSYQKAFSRETRKIELTDEDKQAVDAELKKAMDNIPESVVNDVLAKQDGRTKSLYAAGIQSAVNAINSEVYKTMRSYIEANYHQALSGKNIDKIRQTVRSEYQNSQSVKKATARRLSDLQKAIDNFQRRSAKRAEKASAEAERMKKYLKFRETDEGKAQLWAMSQDLRREFPDAPRPTTTNADDSKRVYKGGPSEAVESWDRETSEGIGEMMRSSDKRGAALQKFVGKLRGHNNGISGNKLRQTVSKLENELYQMLDQEQSDNDVSMKLRIYKNHEGTGKDEAIHKRHEMKDNQINVMAELSQRELTRAVRKNDIVEQLNGMFGERFDKSMSIYTIQIILSDAISNAPSREKTYSTQRHETLTATDVINENMINKTYYVWNGKEYVVLKIGEEMVGFHVDQHTEKPVINKVSDYVRMVDTKPENPNKIPYVQNVARRMGAIVMDTAVALPKLGVTLGLGLTPITKGAMDYTLNLYDETKELKQNRGQAEKARWKQEINKRWGSRYVSDGRDGYTLKLNS